MKKAAAQDNANANVNANGSLWNRKPLKEAEGLPLRIFQKVIKIRVLECRNTYNNSKTSTHEKDVYVQCEALEYSYPSYQLTLLLRLVSKTEDDFYEGEGDDDLTWKESSARVDVTKLQLAIELKAWLHGKVLNVPAIVCSKRVEESLMNFVKFGRQPAQVDLFLWILSRCEIEWNYVHSKIYFGGFTNHELTSLENERTEEFHQENKNTIKNNITEIIEQSMINFENTRGPGSIKNLDMATTTHYSKNRPSSAPPRMKRNDFHTHELTQNFIGRSEVLQSLKSYQIKGRKSAKMEILSIDWDDDKFRLISHLKDKQQEIASAMEFRRKLLKISQARQLQTLHKYQAIRKKNSSNRENYSWARQASYEVMTLDTIGDSVKNDILKQKCNSQRAREHIMWAMAPNGFANRRGRYQKGWVLGLGPLPADATTALDDPKLAYTMNHYYWDQHGRRHTKNPEEIEKGTAIDLAMEAIRKAARNASLYKLDLRCLFDQMDISGDGLLSVNEFLTAFDLLGVKLDSDSLAALFQHFDPNNSGSVHYGEFVWAFFNRRSFVNQWRRALKTQGLTRQQIKIIFEKADRTGDGKLNFSEFKRLLTTTLQIKLSESEIRILMSRFDRDGDGDINFREFLQYAEQECTTDGNVIRQNQDHFNKKSKGVDNKLMTDDPPSYTPFDETNVATYNQTAIQTSLKYQQSVENRVGKNYFK